MPVLENDVLRVILDDDSPRVVSVENKFLGIKLAGAIPGVSDTHYLFVRHQDGFADTPDLEFGRADSGYSIGYRVTVPTPRGGGAFTMRWDLHNDALRLRITDFDEPGDVRIINVDMEDFRVLSANEPDLWMCTEEDEFPVSEFHYERKRYHDFLAFGRENWAATIWCNKPFQPVGLDWIEFPKTPASQVKWASMRFPVYLHRIKDRTQPDFEGELTIVGDRNKDGAVSWQDAADWVRTHIDAEIHPLYLDAMVTKFTNVAPNEGTFTTFKQVLEHARNFGARTAGTTENNAPSLVVYLSGWQHEGHDTKHPSISEPAKDAGTYEDLCELITESRKSGVIVSMHLNLDDMYTDSPEWEPDIIAIGRDGQYVRGPIFGGGQCYRISSYKDFVTGAAERRLKKFLDLYPVRDTIHVDVFSWAPYTESFDPPPFDPSMQMDTLVIGRWGIIDLYNKAGLDFTSEGFTWPFLDKVSYYWHLDSGHEGRVQNHLLHGHAAFGGYGGGRGIPKDTKRYLLDCILHGCTNSTNFVGADRLEDMLSIYYLVHLPWARTARKQILTQSEKDGEFEIVFTDGSAMRGNKKTQAYEVIADGRLMARDFVTVAPLGHDRLIAYSMDGGEFEFPAPEGWANGECRCEAIDVDAEGEAVIKAGDLRLRLAKETGYIIQAS